VPPLRVVQIPLNQPKEIHMKLQAVLFFTVLLAACSQQPGNAEDQPMP
jgi:hypothetical protein